MSNLGLDLRQKPFLNLIAHFDIFIFFFYSFAFHFHSNTNLAKKSNIWTTKSPSRVKIFITSCLHSWCLDMKLLPSLQRSHLLLHCVTPWQQNCLLQSKKPTKVKKKKNDWRNLLNWQLVLDFNYITKRLFTLASNCQKYYSSYCFNYEVRNFFCSFLLTLIYNF